MITQHCYVCGCDIGKYDWPQHVNKEKRLHGKDIYKKLKALRFPKRPKIIIVKDKSLSKFIQ